MMMCVPLLLPLCVYVRGHAHVHVPRRYTRNFMRLLLQGETKMEGLDLKDPMETSEEEQEEEVVMN